ncbi:Ctf8p and Ctf18p associating protein [Entomophthora muscae]|uniref:Ctf8p and Ctf18p associating protein n=1 Tax=Entomophthora muscae TaxID=34485 RepID=A0ACC2RKS8_9FUNG|nr:Ctf8p and Ctf18p associating protein [Entomophthora muscae]
MLSDDSLDVFPVLFTEEVASDDHFLLVEIPHDLLSKFRSLCSSGASKDEKLYIKGRPNDEAVLCSEDRTYALKSAQTSNSLLISKISKGPGLHYNKLEVIHSLKSTIETARISPRLHRVKEVLLPSLYKGTTEKYLQKDKIKFYALQELQAEVQASDLELSDMLQRLRVLTLDGVLRLVDLDYMYEIVCLILECAEAFSFPLEEMDLNLLLEKLSDHEIAPPLISHCLYSVSELLSNGCCKLIESEVSRVLGEKILKSLTEPTTVWDFLERWSKDLPASYQPSMDHLQGLYYLDEDNVLDMSDNNYVHYFSAIDLSFEPKLRFKEIFNQKPRWTPSEIAPFVIDLIPSRDPKELNGFLLRFCRFVTVKEKQYFTCKIKF